MAPNSDTAPDWSPRFTIATPEIAQILGFNKSTIYREILRNGNRIGYKPKEAESRYRHRFRRCKRPYLIQEDREGVVLYLLFSDLSPEQISGRLKLEKSFSISHQSIYNYVYRQYRSLTPYLVDIVTGKQIGRAHV